MRTIYILLFFTISIPLLLSCGTDANEDDPDGDLKEFELASNGITIKCNDANPGDRGTVDGEIYVAVDNDRLRRRADSGSDLTKVCVSLVTNMINLFEDTDFNQAIEHWDVSNVTTMSGMFESSAFNQPIDNWDVSSVTDMSWMFYNNREFNQPVGNWDVSNVTDMSGLFSYTRFKQPIENWDVSSVMVMRRMFDANRVFNQSIIKWDVSS